MHFLYWTLLSRIRKKKTTTDLNQLFGHLISSMPMTFLVHLEFMVKYLILKSPLSILNHAGHIVSVKCTLFLNNRIENLDLQRDLKQPWIGRDKTSYFSFIVVRYQCLDFYRRRN